MTDAFFTRLADDRVVAQEHTRGPWSRDHQHAGPPAALLGGALERMLGDSQVTRLTFEILRPVTIAELTVTAEVVRPGRSVQLAEGTLADDDGPVMLARGWGIRRQDVGLPADRSDEGAAPVAPVPPDQGRAEPFFPVPWDVGYHAAMEVRFVRGGFVEPGPAFAWMRARVPVVADETTTPLQRVLVGADSGNGLSAALPIGEWLFINTDLTVHLHRDPVGEWVGFDASSWLEPHGVGLATTVIVDEAGPVGRGLQSLMIGRH